MPNSSISKEKTISEDVKSFISRYIPSVTHFDVLLLLYNSPHQEFGVKSIEQHLHLRTESIERALNDLVNNKFVVKKGEKSSCYWYLSNKERNNILALLEETYSKNQSEVVNLILKK